MADSRREEGHDPKREPTRVIVVLERARLETAKVGKDFALLDCDTHRSFLLKHRRDPAEFRPDILHQVRSLGCRGSCPKFTGLPPTQSLLALMDSPLNKAGMLKVYIRTERGVLIDVNPQLRVPRTYKRFAGLMVHLLHKLSITAVNSNAKLLRVIKNPVTDHLPPGCRKIATSVKGRLVSLPEFVQTLPKDAPTVFIVGAMAHGSVEEVATYAEECIAMSEYPLSGAAALSRLCTAYENSLGVL